MAPADKTTSQQAAEAEALSPGTADLREPAAAADASPTISVIIPAYNHEDFVDEAVRSVLGQTYADFELVIINDGSRDSTDAKLRSYQDKRIRYYSQQNVGAPATINRGIALARGRYVSILNSDDVYHPDRLKNLLQRLEGDPTLDAVFSYLEFINDAGELVSRYNGPQELWRGHAADSSFKESDNLVLHLLAGNFVCTTSNLFCRRDVFDRIAGFQDFRYVHDHEFFLRLCFHCTARVVPEPLVKYRVHAGNTIKENEPATDFERAIVLTKFLVEHDLSGVFPDSDPHTTALKFLGSFDARNADRLVLTLLLFVVKGYVSHDFLTALPRAVESRLRAGCLERFAKDIDAWRSSQAAWAEWREVNERLNKACEENKELWQTNQEIRKENEKLWKEGQEAWAKWKEVNEALVAAKEENKRVWQEGQEGWAKWHEANERLIAFDHKLNEASSENTRILSERQDTLNEARESRARAQEAEAQLRAEQANHVATKERLAVLKSRLDSVLASGSWRLGRLLTLPLRGVRKLLTSWKPKSG